MYIQPSDRPVPPKNYSGTAFNNEGEPRPFGELPLPQTLENDPNDAIVTVPEPSQPDEAQPVGAIGQERSEEGRGLLSRIPFLSSLLPPPRRRDGKSAALPDWVVIGALALLLLGEEDSDILPFLLLLLLWE